MEVENFLFAYEITFEVDKHVNECNFFLFLHLEIFDLSHCDRIFFYSDFGPRFKIYFLYLLLDLYNDLSCVPESENLKSKRDSGYEKWPFDQLDWDLVIYETRSQSRVPQSPISAISTKITTPLVVNSTETRQMDHVDYPKDYTFERIKILENHKKLKNTIRWFLQKLAHLRKNWPIWKSILKSQSTA